MCPVALFALVVISVSVVWSRLYCVQENGTVTGPNAAESLKVWKEMTRAETTAISSPSPHPGSLSSKVLSTTAAVYGI